MRIATKHVLYNGCKMQTLTDAQSAAGRTTREHPVDAATVDAVLTASRSLIAVATRSLGAAAEETTIAQYRALVVLASRGPQRMVDLAGALGVAPSTAGRMCDRLVRKGLIRRHRARADRRAVLVSVTAAGRLVVDQATARRRALIEDILAKLPAGTQRAVAEALAAFADAAGEVPDSQWPSPGPVDEADAPRPARPTRSAASAKELR
jgi:DNA-binding MarR family transcriptional regulator